MPKTYADWLKQLTKPDLPRVLAFGGEERAFVDEAIEEIKSRFQGPFDEFNREILSLRRASCEQALLAARQHPFMAKERLLLLKDAETLKEEHLPALQQYLLEKNPTTVLVLIFEQIDFRQKIPKLLDASCDLYRFDHPKDREMASIIRMRAQTRGLRLNPDAVQQLQLELGPNLLLLDRALEKLELAYQDHVVTAEQVFEQVAQISYEDAFVLARAILMGNRSQVAKSLAHLKAAQEVPLRLLGVLAWQFRVVLRARLMLDEGETAQEVGSKLHLFGDRLDFALRMAKQLDADRQIERLTSLLKLDKSLKSSRANPWLLFDQFALELETLNERSC
ncbi:MAG: DNA polymerase III subunit delta [Myxococcaceae bacterium]|nr:DNA polymerase III subunit delta [Myxococcaceae bacterium]MBH2006014.1 DNA polymerase III subunit delta [Myxococcaceae bacterium]